MTNVRDYLKKKKERETEKPKINYRERIKSHKFTVFYRSVLIVVLIAAVIAAFYIQWNNKIYTQAVEISSVEINITQDSKLLPFAGHLLTYSKDGAGCMDIKGKAVWNQTFEMQNPIVDICQNVVAIGDYNGRNIYVMDTSGVMGSITVNKPMRDFCVSSKGVVAAVLDDTDTTWIYLYDSQGKELAYFRTTMKDSGYPVNVAISPNGAIVCVSYLFVDSGRMKSSVAFYNFGDVGQNSTNNYASGYDYLDTVVPYARFLDNRSSFAVADNRIMLYGGAQKPVIVLESLIDENVQSVYYGGDYVGLVFNDTEGVSRYRMDVYHKSGQPELKQSIYFDIEYSDIIFHEDQIIIYNETECCIYKSNGTEKYSGSFDKTTLVLIPQSTPYRYMLVTPDSIDTIELQ